MFRFNALLQCIGNRLREEFDVVIVGGGPSSLSAAIRLKQLSKNLRIAIVEKGSMIGAHTLSGACIETRSLDELLLNWKEMNSPIKQKATQDDMYVLTKNSYFKSPFLPLTLHNKNNYIVSLGSVCKWLAEVAEELEVEIYPGFSASDVYYSDNGKHVKGIILNDTGINKKGEKTENFQQGMIFEAKQTIFAEGCRGSCTKKLEMKFNLRERGNFQTYALGIKELWEIDKEKHVPGKVLHTVGWPLTRTEGHYNAYGGSFMYHYGDQLVSTGLVVSLDYKNPYVRPYMEFQKWKTHPFIRKVLEGGKPIGYGARTLSEGGIRSMPKLYFPGGVLVGECAGFLNLPKIKGTHTSMKSGIIAAESIFNDVFDKKKQPEFGVEVSSYESSFVDSWLFKELYMVRNVRQNFAKNFYWGMLYTGITATVSFGKEPWTLAHKHEDHAVLLPANKSKPIQYPKPDGKLTFDLLTNLSLSGVTHNADQPPHLKLKQWDVAKSTNLSIYEGPEQRYCPAGVYEFVEDGKKTKELIINAQNCLHCKACDIKDPTQNIEWTCPEGSGGPNYNGLM